MPLFAKSIECHPLNANPAATTNAYRRTTKMLKEITQQAGFETISAHGMSNRGMKRTYFPGLIDIVVVTDPAEIRTISNDSRFDRDFILHGPVRDVQRLRKMLRIFSLDGKLFEPMLPRTDPSRAAAQDELWSRLSLKADEVKHGPAQLEPLAEWVRGIGTAEKVDLLVQQSIGRLFVETFTATAESLAAAHMVLEAATASNVLKMFWWRISGRLERAKALLASRVNGDLVGVIGMITARQLIVDGLHKMRQLAADPALRIVTSSSSVRVGAAVPPKSGCLRYWKECGRVPQLRCISLKKPHGPIPP